MKTFEYHALLWLLLILVSKGVSQERTKSSIFDSKPIRVQDYGTPPVTSTIPLYDCTSSHRPKIDVPSAFEVYHNKQWYLQSCEEGLTWNQTLCRCEFPNGKRVVVQCRDYRATSTELTGTYEQLVNGQWIVRDCSLAVAGLVWDQEACQCVWGPNSKEMFTGQGIAPCEIMLNMTFENGVKDEAKGSFIEVGRGNPVPISAVHKRDSPDGYKAAYFSGTALNIWYFAGNELGTSLRVEFRFKMTNDPVQRDKYQIFISNGCNVSAPGYTTPSLAIGYRAADQSYLLAFETATARKAIVCTRKLGAYDWHTISLIYEDGTLLFRVDDNPCIISQDFSGPIQKTPCPLTVGADPLERESMYKGYLDNLLIARYCRRFMDTDPNDAKDKAKGPMLVETAPLVNDLDVQLRSGKDNLLGKSGRNKPRGVTSSKYFPEIPSIVNYGSEYSEKMTQDTDYTDSTSDSEKTRDFTNSFRRPVKPERNKPDFGRKDSSEGRHNNENNRYERTDEQTKGFDYSGKKNEEDNNDDQSGKTIESKNVYGRSRSTRGQDGGYSTSGKKTEPANGYAEFQNNGESDNSYVYPEKTGESDDTYAYPGKTGRQRSGESENSPGKRGRQTTGYRRFDDESDKSTNIYRTPGGQVSEYDNFQKVNSKAKDNINYDKSSRRGNENANLGNNRFDSSFQNLGRRRGNINDFTDSTKDVNYGRKMKQNNGQDSYENKDDYVNYNSEEMEEQRKGEQKDNRFTNPEKKKRNGNMLGFSETVRIRSEDSLNKENNYQNNFQDQGKATEERSNLDSSKKIEGSESEFEKSDESFDGYESSRGDYGYKSERDNVDTSLRHSNTNGPAEDTEKRSVKNWKYRNNRSEKGDGYINNNNNNNGKTNVYEGPAKRGQNMNDKIIQRGIKGDSNDNEKGNENDDNFNSEKEDEEGSESDADYESTGQTKGNTNTEEDRNSENTGYVKRYENRPKKEYEITRERNTLDNGPKKENKNAEQTRGYRRTGQTQGYQNTGQSVQYENGQVNRGNMQKKRASHFDIQREKRSEKIETFQGGKKLDLDTESPSAISIQTQSLKKQPVSETEHVALETSSYQNMLGDSSRKSNKKIDSSVQGEDKPTGQIPMKSELVNGDTDVTQESISGSMQNFTGSAPNLVKGKRRFGSKKINWYDKADTNQSSQEESSNSDKQNLDDKSVDKLPTVGYDIKKLTQSGTLDAANTASIDSKSQKTQGNDKIITERLNHNTYTNDHRNTDISEDKKIRQDTPIKGLEKSSTESSFSKTSGKVSRNDYDSDVNDVSKDDTVSQPSDTSPEKAKRSKGHGYSGSRNAKTDKPSQKRSGTIQTDLPDARKNQFDNSIFEVRTTGNSTGHEQRPTKPSFTGKVNDKSVVERGAKRRLDMPVDVTKIRSFKSLDVNDGLRTGRTHAAPRSLTENDQSTLSSKNGK